MCLRERGVHGAICIGLGTKLLVKLSLFDEVFRLAWLSDISASLNLPCRGSLCFCIGLEADSPFDSAHSLRRPKNVFSSRPVASFTLAFAAFLYHFFFCQVDHLNAVNLRLPFSTHVICSWHFCGLSFAVGYGAERSCIWYRCVTFILYLASESNCAARISDIFLLSSQGIPFRFSNCKTTNYHMNDKTPHASSTILQTSTKVMDHSRFSGFWKIP